MKILVDQNISFRTISILPKSGKHVDSKLAFPEWIHVNQLGLEHESDPIIWKFANKEKYDAILSADQDFYKILLQNGIPPKLIWMRIGNGSYQRVGAVLNRYFDEIMNFLNSSELECFEIWP